MIKKIVMMIVLILTTSCGYEAIYSKKNLIKYSDFSINELNLSGDRIANQKIKELLYNYSNLKKKQNFDLNLVTSFTKNIIGKNAKGDTTLYNLEIILDVQAINRSNDKTINLKFSENIKYNVNQDRFALKKKEIEIKQNLSEITIQQLLNRLINN